MHRSPSSAAALATLLFCCLPPAAVACDAPQTAQQATSKHIRRFVQGKGMAVLTFAGYSGAGYEDVPAMLETAGHVLNRHDPARTLVNIGATEQGIGTVYELAKRMGFTTLGIVSTLARDNQVPISPCVDFVFFVQDTSWGGRLPGSARLSPTSVAIVENSTSFVGIGGGEVARDELLAAHRAGKPTRFMPADMNHGLAREKALKNGAAPPTDFRGAADGPLRAAGVAPAIGR
jgi:hypothetical protein